MASAHSVLRATLWPIRHRAPSWSGVPACGHPGSTGPGNFLERRYGQARLVPVAAQCRSRPPQEGSGEQTHVAGVCGVEPPAPGLQHPTCTDRGPQATAAARNEASPPPAALSPPQAQPSHPHTAALLSKQSPIAEREGRHLLSLHPSLPRPGPTPSLPRPGPKASGRRPPAQPWPVSAHPDTFPLAAWGRGQQPRAGERLSVFDARAKGGPHGVQSPARHHPQPRGAAPPRRTPLTPSLHWRWGTWREQGPRALPTPHSAASRDQQDDTHRGPRMVQLSGKQGLRQAPSLPHTGVHTSAHRSPHLRTQASTPPHTGARPSCPRGGVRARSPGDPTARPAPPPLTSPPERGLPAASTPSRHQGPRAWALASLPVAPLPSAACTGVRGGPPPYPGQATVT